MCRTFRFGYSGISFSALMDALIEPKDYIALSYHAIHVVEVLRCSLLQPLMGGGKLFAVWRSEYTRFSAIIVVYGINIVSNHKEWSTVAAY